MRKKKKVVGSRGVEARHRRERRSKKVREYSQNERIKWLKYLACSQEYNPSDSSWEVGQGHGNTFTKM